MASNNTFQTAAHRLLHLQTLLLQEMLHSRSIHEECQTAGIIVAAQLKRRLLACSTS